MDSDQLARYIPEVVARLQTLDPVKIILFGSAAHGTTGETSDLDLLVVTKSDATPANHREKEAIYLEVARLLRDKDRRFRSTFSSTHSRCTPDSSKWTACSPGKSCRRAR